ncbi:hypothetical protein AB9N12_06260 [Bacteroides sp. AN502(2024)]|uniref:hypothetical protein n=1 Tax=Bacteroides sp. AN502(2024) TaxID=3160599 RepID=UPI0035138204
MFPPIYLGQYCPKWDNAIASSQKNLVCYDIPIDAGFRYKAIYVTYELGQATINVVRTYQKLLIVKDTHTKLLGQYILTLIPDKEYERKNKDQVCDKFINCADKGTFTGVAIYSMPQTDLIIRANRYENGIKKKGASLLDKSKTPQERIATIKSILGGIHLKRSTSIKTRSFEDDYNYNDDYDNNYDDSDNWQYDDYWVVGDGLYYDPNNDQFLVDYDGDGNPESVWLPEVDVTPNEPDPDPFPEPDPDPDDNTDDSNDNPWWEWGEGDDWWADNEETDYTELGREGLEKIRTDLKNGNVKVQQVKMSQGQAVLTAASVGLNTNGILTSCLNFLNESNVDKLATKFGNSLGGVGFGVGAYQTYVAFTDGDISNADIVGAVSTALSAVGVIAIFCPISAPIVGVVGVTSCVLGLISTMTTSDIPTLLEIELENGANIYIYMSSQDCSYA